MAPAGGIAEAIRKPANQVPADSILTDSRTEWGKMQTKQCTQCKETKDVSCFYRRPKNSSGLRSDCKSCCAKQNRAYNIANRESISQYNKKYKTANLERELERHRHWYRDNRLHAIQYSNDYLAQRLAVDPNYVRDKSRQWVEKNREVTRLRAHLRRTAKHRANSFFVSQKDLQKIRLKPCTYCGTTEEIQIDHVIPLARGGAHSIGNLAPACRLCNNHKRAKFVTEWRLELKKKGGK